MLVNQRSSCSFLESDSLEGMQCNSDRGRFSGVVKWQELALISAFRFLEVALEVDGPCED
jgi:hypothetical protein